MLVNTWPNCIVTPTPPTARHTETRHSEDFPLPTPPPPHRILHRELEASCDSSSCNNSRSSNRESNSGGSSSWSACGHGRSQMPLMSTTMTTTRTTARRKWARTTRSAAATARTLTPHFLPHRLRSTAPARKEVQNHPGGFRRRCHRRYEAEEEKIAINYQKYSSNWSDIGIATKKKAIC